VAVNDPVSKPVVARWDLEWWFRVLCIALAVLALVIAIAAVALVYVLAPTLDKVNEAMARLKVVLSYEILVVVFFFGLMVLLYMAVGKIDLSSLLSEKGPDGTYGASMSRFQLLIFTFVIALSLFLIVVSTGATNFPAIPSEVLMLLGISASTYAVSKGIQGSNGGGGGAAPGAAQSAHGAAATAHGHADAAQASAAAAQDHAAVAQSSAGTAAASATTAQTSAVNAQNAAAAAQRAAQAAQPKPGQQ